MRSFALIGFATLVLAPHALGQYLDSQVNPETFKSPSGRYQLRVNPDDPHASQGGNYRLSLDGKVLWQKHFPFALLQAGVTDEGRFGGYAVRGTDFKLGEIVIVVAGSNGQIALSETHKRRATQVMHGSPDPKIEGLIFDAEDDRMTIRVSDPDVNKGSEQWWTYRLSDGKPGSRFEPKRYMGERTTWITEARTLPGTPLTLLSWWHYDDKAGAILTLVDADAKPVWRLDLKGDYEIGKDEFEHAAATMEFQRSGSILATAKNRFSIRRVRQKQKAFYSVEASGDTWKVTETGRQPYSPPATSKFQNPAVPQTSLRLVSKWKIPLGPVAPSAIHDIEDFEVVDGKWLAILCGGETPGLVVTDQAGRNARKIPLPKLNDVSGSESCLASLGRNRFLVTKTKSYRPSSTSAWLVDIVSRKVIPLTIPGKARITAAASFADGGFVTLETEDHAYTMSEGITVYDRFGKVSWRGEHGGGYGGEASELLSPEDVAVDSRGRIVVLDVIKHTLQFFSRGGKYLTNIDLDKVWKNQPEYPTQVRCIGDGFLLWDMSVAYRLDSKGRILETITPHLANSKPVDSRFDPQVDASGRIWLSDSEALYRLNKKGVVDATIGRVGGIGGLHKIENLLVAPGGMTYAFDATSREVHVFDPAGKRKVVVKPLRRDLKDSSYYSDDPLAVDDLGRIYVSGGAGGLVRYSALGKREIEIDPKWEAGGPVPRAWERGWWWFGTRLMDGKGKVVTTIDRLPNEDWVSRPSVPISVSAGGSLAVLESGDIRRNREKVKMGFYSPTGAPQATAEIQWDTEKLWQFAYDGRMVYFPREKDLLAFDKTGKPVWRFVLPPRKGAQWQAFPLRDGVAMFDGIDTVYSYATRR